MLKPYKRISLFLCSASDKDLEEEANVTRTQDDATFNGETTSTTDHDGKQPVNGNEPDEDDGMEPDEVVPLCQPVAGNRVKCPGCQGFYSSDVITEHAELCTESETVTTFIEIMDGSDFAYTIETEPIMRDEQTTDLDRTTETNDTTQPTGDAGQADSISTKDILTNLTGLLGPVSSINVYHRRLFEDYVDNRRKCLWHKSENSIKLLESQLLTQVVRKGNF